jgi:hypothetical protein
MRATCLDTPWFDHPDNIWRRVQIVKCLITQFSSPSCCLLPPRSKIFSSVSSVPWSQTPSPKFAYKLEDWNGSDAHTYSMICWCSKMYFFTEKAGGARTQHSYSRVARFISRPGHWLPWIEVSHDFPQSPPGKCQDNTYIRPWPLLPNPFQFIIYQLSRYSTLYSLDTDSLAK